ncbi:MAG: hypothetical protein BAJATHORv1_30123 [Candidatus Thorarchaeota archaeon]|nr:MAG: hypothetical protein BAJATHORv1_30123 [Candidatus Thorarchaeota archaeon]
MTEQHSDLIRYARESIDSDKHEDDMHPFSLYVCEVCLKYTPLEITLRFNTDQVLLPLNSFIGHIQGKCSSCGKTTLLMSNSDEDDTTSRIFPVCSCGSKQFIAGMCERIQGEKGIPGLFEKRVIVAKCARCSKIQTIAFTE